MSAPEIGSSPVPGTPAHDELRHGGTGHHGHRHHGHHHHHHHHHRHHHRLRDRPDGEVQTPERNRHQAPPQALPPAQEHEPVPEAGHADAPGADPGESSPTHGTSGSGEGQEDAASDEGQEDAGSAESQEDAGSGERHAWDRTGHPEDDTSARNPERDLARDEAGRTRGQERSRYEEGSLWDQEGGPGDDTEADRFAHWPGGHGDEAPSATDEAVAAAFAAEFGHGFQPGARPDPGQGDEHPLSWKWKSQPGTASASGPAFNGFDLSLLLLLTDWRQ